jgi:hypothetical protein
MISVYSNLEVPYVSSTSDSGVLGEVRAIDGQLKVYNGNSWIDIRTTAFIDDLDLKTVVEWAKQKMEQELREQHLAEKYPAFKAAKEKYQLVKAIVENG